MMTLMIVKFNFRSSILMHALSTISSTASLTLGGWWLWIYFQFNKKKTKVIFFWSNSTSRTPDVDLSSLASDEKPVITKLGVKKDAAPKLDKHVNEVVKSCFFHLMHLSKVKPLMILNLMIEVNNNNNNNNHTLGLPLFAVVCYHKSLFLTNGHSAQLLGKCACARDCFDKTQHCWGLVNFCISNFL